MSQKNGNSDSGRANNAPSKSGASNGRVPPPNARTIKDSYKTGTISRAAARAAVRAVTQGK